MQQPVGARLLCRLKYTDLRAERPANLIQINTTSGLHHAHCILQEVDSLKPVRMHEQNTAAHACIDWAQNSVLQVMQNVFRNLTLTEMTL